jgi:hypothetical protein
MEFIVWVETRLAGKTLAVEEVAKFDRCTSGIASEERTGSRASARRLWICVSWMRAMASGQRDVRS